jgi:PTH1 family peptidyl-tRNA hydrolase
MIPLAHSSFKMNLIASLGNPGREYENTRHNLGWLMVDDLHCCSSLRWKEKFKGLYFKTTEHGNDFVFLKPQTFMNLSGQSVKAAMTFFKVPLEDVLIVHDELDFPFGTIGFKSGGGLAGNNGLKSIAEQLGSKDFKRLRLGIGRPKYGDVSNHVLSKFSSEEGPLLDDYKKLGTQALDSYMKEGFAKAANKYSKKSFIQ